MTTETQAAIVAELQRQGEQPVDQDVFKVVNVPDYDLADARALAALARSIVEEHPNLFKKRDWTTLDNAAFKEQESEFRERLRQPEKLNTSEFKELDAALLSPEQEGALRKYLSGSAGNFEKSILKAALAEQKQLLKAMEA